MGGTIIIRKWNWTHIAVWVAVSFAAIWIMVLCYQVPIWGDDVGNPELVVDHNVGFGSALIGTFLTFSLLIYTYREMKGYPIYERIELCKETKKVKR